MVSASRCSWIVGNLVGALVLLGAGAAQADPEETELFDYTVKPGDNCRKLAFHFFGSRDRIDVLHRYNKNLGELRGPKDSHNLRPGMRLRILAPKPDARLSFVKNE